MLKSIKIKVILIFVIFSIILTISFATYLSYIIQNIDGVKYTSEVVQTVMNSVLYAVAVYVVVAIILGLIVSKVVTYPISKVTKNVKKTILGKIQKSEGISGIEKGNEIDDLINAFSIMTDELQQNLDEVSKQKSQIETILLHMTDGVIAFDMDGKITHANHAAINMLKLTDGDNTFTKIFRKLNIDISIEKIVYLENWTSSEQKMNIEDNYFNMFFAPYKDEKDRPAGVMVVIQDVTEHVKLDNMRKEFVADVSHELKTPLTSIMGYSDTLLDRDYDRDTQIRFMRVISSEANRMAKLVRDLLQLSKFDTKGVKSSKTEYNLGDQVKRCQEKLRFEYEKKKQKVECFVTANVPLIYADPDGIEQVILNILSNSIKYTPEEGNIKVYVGFVYNAAYIKVIDNGIGIPKDDVDRVFDRFYRVDKARARDMGGTGLGLSIAKEILNLNDGSIDMRSELGKGTEVVIRVPVAKSE